MTHTFDEAIDLLKWQAQAHAIQVEKLEKEMTILQNEIKQHEVAIDQFKEKIFNLNNSIEHLYQIK